MVIKMRLIKLLLPTLLAFVAVPQAALADNPCSSIATREPSQETRRFDNKKISFEMPANYRIMNTEFGLMIHSPWSYEVYNCQINSKYGSGEVESGIVVSTLPFNQISKLIDNMENQAVSYGGVKKTFYPGTTAKMFAYQTSEAAFGKIIFVKNNQLVVIEIPLYVEEEGKDNWVLSTEVHQMYKPTVDLIMSTLQVR